VVRSDLPYSVTYSDEIIKAGKVSVLRYIYFVMDILSSALRGISGFGNLLEIPFISVFFY